MPRLQGHTRLEEDLLITMSVRSRQSSRDTLDEVLKKIKSTGQISTLARFKNGAESYGIGPKCRFHFWVRCLFFKPAHRSSRKTGSTFRTMR
jgi:hypothetical protein